MTLKTWLKHLDALLNSEDGELGPTLGGPSLARVRADLRRRMRQNDRYFRIAFALAILLALVTLVMTIAHGSAAGWVPKVFGVSTFGAVVFASNAARDKHAFDVMIELALGLGDKEAQMVLAVLAKRFSGAGARRSLGRKSS